MISQTTKHKRWNIFVRELEDLLQKHERDLNDLINEAGLHPEKVRRLKQSLIAPRFHLLSPEDLEQVTMTFHLTGEEQLRLRAAILATAVEETLMNRIDADNAMRAAEEIFPILVKALQKRLGQQRGLAATRKQAMTEETTNDVLEPTLERFDQAILALHLSLQGKISTEQIEQAIKARNGFTTVLADLESLNTTDPIVALTDAWQVWYQETQKNLAVALENLLRLQPSSDQ
jgi:hypothetical protein